MEHGTSKCFFGAKANKDHTLNGLESVGRHGVRSMQQRQAGKAAPPSPGVGLKGAQ